MTKDLNKNILSIQYNSLNLPASITFKDGKTIQYTYGADGRKLKVVYTTKQPSTTHVIDYCGNMIYEEGKLKRMLVDGAYISFDKGYSEYFYYIQDHLGNNRVIFNIDSEAEQMNRYYPYGGLMAESTGWDVQRYKYNGKEFDRMHGLDWYDYGARMYDPAVGQYHTMDRFAEKYYNLSPYSYCAGNPINSIDVNGDSTELASGSTLEFCIAVNTAKLWLKQHDADGVYKALEARKEMVTIKESSNSHSNFDPKTNTIYWNPSNCLVTENAILSPTTIINHEFDHALEKLKDPATFEEKIKTLSGGSLYFEYGNLEDKRVITTTEYNTAKKLNEVMDKTLPYTRKDHNGILYKVNSPISNTTLNRGLDMYNMNFTVFGINGNNKK